jgi:hypothetical protein
MGVGGALRERFARCPYHHDSRARTAIRRNSSPPAGATALHLHCTLHSMELGKLDHGERNRDRYTTRSPKAKRKMMMIMMPISLSQQINWWIIGQQRSKPSKDGRRL